MLKNCSIRISFIGKFFFNQKYTCFWQKCYRFNRIFFSVYTQIITPITCIISVQIVVYMAPSASNCRTFSSACSWDRAPWCGCLLTWLLRRGHLMRRPCHSSHFMRRLLRQCPFHHTLSINQHLHLQPDQFLNFPHLLHFFLQRQRGRLLIGRRLLKLQLQMLQLQLQILQRLP